MNKKMQLSKNFLSMSGGSSIFPLISQIHFFLHNPSFSIKYTIFALLSIDELVLFIL